MNSIVFSCTREDLLCEQDRSHGFAWNLPVDISVGFGLQQLNNLNGESIWLVYEDILS